MEKLNKWYLKPFYYRINDKYYYDKWTRPTDEKLKQLLNYFNHNFKYANLFQIYLTGRFNSNQKTGTWDIDLLITYKDIQMKDYNMIYDCLFFLKDTVLTQFKLLTDVKYRDNIHIEHIANIEEDKVYEYIKTAGETIIYDLIIEKYDNHKLTNFQRNINNYILIESQKCKLYKVNINKYDYSKLIKFKNYIQNGCIYYDHKLLD